MPDDLSAEELAAIDIPKQLTVQILDDTDAPPALAATIKSFDDTTLILALSGPGAGAGVEVGAAINVGYPDHAGFCEFESKVLEVLPGEPDLLSIEPARQTKTIQRRRHIRADVDMPVACALLDPEAMSFMGASGEIGNLGGGGLMMYIRWHPALIVGASLTMALTVPTQPTILALTKVVDVVEPESDDEPAVVRVAFSLLSSDDGERIERFVYRQLGGSAPAKLWSPGKLTKAAQ
ncbi:MAG: PilZ domain-containing protein [Actinomycetota bacterium]|nr:PilZ domain-containing protein [Actinomycetota bacterium]